MKTLLILIYTILPPGQEPDVTVYEFPLPDMETCKQAIAEKPEWLFHAGDINLADYRATRAAWCETAK